jgi:hypothetical protein
MFDSLRSSLVFSSSEIYFSFLSTNSSFYRIRVGLSGWELTDYTSESKISSDCLNSSSSTCSSFWISVGLSG